MKTTGNGLTLIALSTGGASLVRVAATIVAAFGSASEEKGASGFSISQCAVRRGLGLGHEGLPLRPESDTAEPTVGRGVMGCVVA